MRGPIGCVAVVCVVGLACVGPAWAQTASRVIRLIDQRCANCHRATAAADRAPDVDGAPEMATLRQMAPETILQAITKGAMRVHAEDVADEVKRAMAEFISGRKLGPLTLVREEGRRDFGQPETGQFRTMQFGFRVTF